MQRDQPGPEETSQLSLRRQPDHLVTEDVVERPLGCTVERDGGDTVGQVLHIDREVGDMIPRDEDGQIIPLSQDLGRRFLYARYNADLSREGLDALGLKDIEPKNVQKLDSIEYIPDLRKVGRKLAKEIKIEHFGSFVS